MVDDEFLIEFVQFLDDEKLFERWGKFLGVCWESIYVSCNEFDDLDVEAGLGKFYAAIEIDSPNSVFLLHAFQNWDILLWDD